MDTQFEEAERALRNALDAPEPTTWRPDDPAEGHAALLIGELVSVAKGTTSWGPRQIAIVKDAAGTLWNVWLLHKVLIDEFLTQQPKIGEMLAIRYDGRVEPEGGSPYEMYRLLVHRKNQPVQWLDPNGAKPAPAPAPAPTPSAPAPSEPPPAAQFTAPVGTQTAIDTDPAAAVCDFCGFANGRHAAGCPTQAPSDDDIPF